MERSEITPSVCGNPVHARQNKSFKYNGIVVQIVIGFCKKISNSLAALASTHVTWTSDLDFSSKGFV